MNLPGFVQNAFDSVEAMEKFSQLLLDSKLCPDHFYEKVDNKPDYTKGKVPAVMMVLLQGYQLNLPPMTALQHIVPVNGLLSIKGDAAKSMIFGSGKLAKDSWREETSGSVEAQNYTVSITATRSDNGQTLTRSFSVELAKRAGLWVTPSMIQGQDGWKHKKSAWYKYPERMISYRALGFIARDLFPDVMSGIYTTEEAIDLPQDDTLIIETTSGAAIQIPDRNFNEERSQTLTSKATEKIDKRNHVEPPPENVRQQPMTTEEAYPAPTEEPVKEEGPQRAGSKTMLNGTEGAIPVFTEKELQDMAIDFLHSMIEKDDLMVKERDADPGKNTNKKLRTIILAHYAGALEHSVLNQPAGSDPDDMPEPPDPETTREDADPYADQRMDASDMEMMPDQNEDMEPNTGFDDPGSEIEEGVDINKFGIVVPNLVDGKRAFDVTKTLFEDMANMAGVDNKVYETLITTKFPEFQQYRTKEDFCYKAPAEDINRLLNSVG